MNLFWPVLIIQTVCECARENDLLYYLRKKRNPDVKLIKKKMFYKKIPVCMYIFDVMIVRGYLLISSC